MVSRYHVSFCACNPAWLAPELLVSMGPSPFLWFLHAKQRLLEQNYKSVGTQTSPVLLCMQISVISTINTGPLGPRHNLSFCACKTAWIAPDLLISMGPSPHLWFLHAKQRLLDQWTSLYGCQTSPVVLCMQNSAFWSRISVSMGPIPDLQFLHAKQRVFDQNYKSLCVPDLTCPFVHAK